MNRMFRAITGVVFVLVITFCAVSICQNAGKGLKVDVTGQKLYTLCPGTRAILARLNQPVRIKFYYAKTAALKGPDQIKYFNNYYEYVKALLEEYAKQAKGMIELEIIDPRPFSEEELAALRYGLKRFSITEEENFFFGLALQTQFGVEKVIPFFSPDRENFIEYDISYLIDSAITRQKTKVGIISSLDVMGDDVTGYMAQMMRMQGQTPQPPWTFVEQLRQKYQVTDVPADVNEIKDIDILLIIHPKDLPEKTLFAIDQFVLKGGRTVICVDPFCFADQPPVDMMQRQQPKSPSSDLNALLRTWGLQMAKDTFAGDRSLALKASLNASRRPEPIIGYLNLTSECFSKEHAITADLNQVRYLFAGVLTEVPDVNERLADIKRTPIVTTTARGNSWSANSYELNMLNPSRLMDKFIDGSRPVAMGYLVTGRFKSSFPDGIEVEIAQLADSNLPDDPNQKMAKQINGLAEAREDCAVVVFSDVDFITDMLAYQKNMFFGNIVVGDNSALMLNSLDSLAGSSDLISVRSRGNFNRPFVRVDEIERQAEAETAEEEAKINAEIAGFQSELQSMLSSAKEGQEDIIGSTILQKKKDLELKIHQARRQLRQVKMRKRQHIEHLGNMLRNFDMLTAPGVILLISITLALRRSAKKRYYISHASDS